MKAKEIEEDKKHNGVSNAEFTSTSGEDGIQLSPPDFDLNAEHSMSTEILDVAQLSPESTFQMKPEKSTRKLTPHVKIPIELSQYVLGVNLALKFQDFGLEMWGSIQKLKTPEGIIGTIEKYLGVSSEGIETSFDKYKKRNEALDPSYNKSHHDLTDEQMGGTGKKRLGNAVEGTKEIATKATFKGLKLLAKLKKLTLTDAFFWGLEQVISKGYKDEVSDIKKVAGLAKGKDFIKSKRKEAIASAITHDFLHSKQVTNQLKAAGYTNKQYRDKAINASVGDFKATVVTMLNHNRGISLNKAKFWTDMGKVRSRQGAIDFLREADEYLSVDKNKGLLHNDVIFNSRFIKQFNRAYAQAKKPTIKKA